MFGKNKKASPESCSFAKVDISKDTNEQSVVVIVPDKSSNAYALTLQYGRGSFDNGRYASLYGKWNEQTELQNVTTFLGTFSCRRTQNEDLPTITSEAISEVNASTLSIQKVKDLGWCATCPYATMNRIEADQYDTAVMNTEAERLRAQLALQQGRDELGDYMRHRGLGEII